VTGAWGIGNIFASPSELLKWTRQQHIPANVQGSRRWRCRPGRFLPRNAVDGIEEAAVARLPESAPMVDERRSPWRGKQSGRRRQLVANGEGQQA
jgi:hypothetical protein